jgi:hypothetical protein
VPQEVVAALHAHDDEACPAKRRNQLGAFPGFAGS